MMSQHVNMGRVLTPVNVWFAVVADGAAHPQRENYCTLQDWCAWSDKQYDIVVH